MKKCWTAFIVVFIIALVGCKKDPIFYTLNSSATVGGTITPLGVTSVEEGKSIVFTIKPDDHYSIASITVDGVKVPVAGTIEVKNVTSNKAIKVEFASKVTITAVAGPGGKVSPSSIEVDPGSDISFTLTPDVGFRNAATISVNGKLEPLSGNTYILSDVANNYELKADFEKNMQWYLLQNDWEKTVWQKRLVTANEDDWAMTVVAPQLAFEKLVYYENNRFEMFNEKGVLYGDGNYFVKGDSVISGTDSNGNGGIRRKIIKVDDKILIVVRLGKYQSAPYVWDPSKDEYVRETYVAIKK